MGLATLLMQFNVSVLQVKLLTLVTALLHSDLSCRPFETDHTLHVVNASISKMYNAMLAFCCTAAHNYSFVSPVY